MSQPQIMVPCKPSEPSPRLVIEATYHTESHSLVAVHEIAEVFACRGDGDTLLIPEFVEATLHAQVRLPVLTVGWKIIRQMFSNEDTHFNLPAPPAIVPSRYGLISMTFFTVPEATRG